LIRFFISLSLNLVLGAVVLSSWCRSWKYYKTSNTKYQTPSTKHQAPSTKHQAPSTKHQAPINKKNE